MKLERLLNNIDVIKISGGRDQEIAGITEDSRQVGRGYLFAAIKGVNTDGHRYIEEALDRGAAAILTEDEPQIDDKSTWIRVRNSRRAISRAADNFYGNPSRKLLVAGITGTNGKTTIGYLLEKILNAAGHDCGLLGTVEYRYRCHTEQAARTTPEAAGLHRLMEEMSHRGAQAVVMEVSSHALDQHRVDDVEFDLGIFSNLTQDHLDYHRDMESYLRAKERLFTEVPRMDESDPRYNKIAGQKFMLLDSDGPVTVSGSSDWAEPPAPEAQEVPKPVVEVSVPEPAPEPEPAVLEAPEPEPRQGQSLQNLALANTPLQSGKVLQSPSGEALPPPDPWAAPIPTESTGEERVVKPGEKIKIGGSGS